MAKIPIGNGDWVIICDRERALFCVNAGDGTFLNLEPAEEYRANRPARSNNPDRVWHRHVAPDFADGATGRADWRGRKEHAFLSAVAQRINRAAASKETYGLLLAAPSRAISVIDPLLSPAARRMLRGTVNKDYVGEPLSEVEKHLTA